MNTLLNIYRDLKISHKIYGLLGLLIATNTGILVAILLQMGSIKQEINEVAHKHMPLTELVSKLTIHQLEQAIQFERALHHGEISVVSGDAYHKESYVSSRKKYKEFGRLFDKDIAVIQVVIDGALQGDVSEATEKEYQKLKKLITHAAKAHKDYEIHANAVFAKLNAGNKNIIEQTKKIEKEEDALDHEIESILEEIERFTQASLTHINEHEERALTFGIIATIVAIILSFGSTTLVVIGITRPLKKVVSALGRLGRGDTAVELHSDANDEIGETTQAYEKLRLITIKAEKLTEKQQQEDEKSARRAELIKQLTMEFEASADEVLDAVTQSANSLQEMANVMKNVMSETDGKSAVVAAASQQASSNVETVSAATEELDTSIREIYSQIEQSGKIAEKAVEQSVSTNDSVRSLEKAAGEIGEVTQLISDIAEQTNLLALNATIEAARAGDAGKGFAVVASEVKGLATQTAKATESISTQIMTIQTATGKAVEEIDVVGSTIKRMDEITAVVSGTVQAQADATKSIAHSLQQASAGTLETSEAIVEVKNAMTETSQVTTVLLSSAQNLMKRSKALRDNVHSFVEAVRSA